MRTMLFSLLILVVATSAVGVGAAAEASEAAAVLEQSLDVTYDAERREMAGTLITSVPSSQASVYFLLLPNLDRERNPYLSSRAIDDRYPFGFEESALDVEQVTLLDGESRRVLPFRLLAVPPGLQTFSLADAVLAVDDVQTASAIEIRFVTRAPRVASGDGGVTDDVFAWRFGWYPLALEAGGLREEAGTLYAGDSDAFPLVFPRALIEARVTLPADMVLTAGSDAIERLAPSSADEDAATYVLRNDSPTRSLALVFAPALERYVLDGPTPIEVTFRTGHADEARLLATYARDILADFAQRFGAYPRAVLRIVEGPNRDGSAFSADGIALLSSRFFTHRDILLPGVLHRLTEFVLAHEIAHQWFGMRGGIDLDRDAWLSEGLAQYAAVGYFERTHGATDPNLILVAGHGVLESLVAKQFGFFNLREHMVELPYMRELWSGFDEALVKPLSELRYANVNAVRLYDKGFVVARALSAAVGGDAFDRALAQALVDNESGRLDPEALRRLVEEAAGRSFEAWFDAWVYGDASADYSAKIVGRAEKDATYETEVRVRRDGGVPQDVEVEARLVSGATTRLVWDAAEEEGTLVFRTPSPVSRVTVDPDHRLPDRDRVNNNSPVRLVVAADEAAFPLDGYVIAPDAGSSGVSLSLLDRFRVGVSQSQASLVLRRGRGEVIDAELSFAGAIQGSVGYSLTTYAERATGAPGASWEPRFTFSVSAKRLVSDAAPLYVLSGSMIDLPMTGKPTEAGVAVAVASTGALRLSAAATGEIGVLPQAYLQLAGFVGFGLEALPSALRFGFSELHAAKLAAADVKMSGSLGFDLPSLGDLPYNLLNLAMIDEVRMRLYIAGGAGWTSSDRFGTTSAGAEVGMEQVFALSTLGGFLPFEVRVGIAVPLQGALMPVLYADFSL